MPHKILVLYGSYRADRLGIRLARYVVRELNSLRAEAALIDAKAIDRPMLNRMYKEHPVGEAPPALEELAEKIRKADAFVFVTGEYNWGVQPGLKNLTNHFLEEWFWRPAAIASYSAGRFGNVLHTRKGDTMNTIVWQRIEAAIVFVTAIALFAFLDHSLTWWLAVILFFLPDVSFAGYALGPKAGAVVYNLVHVYALGMVLLAVGIVIGSGTVAALGTLWMGHSGFDRMLGFGLKSPEGFKMTHLGQIG